MADSRSAPPEALTSAPPETPTSALLEAPTSAPSEAPTFVHLHLHTEYSLLDGAVRLRDLPARLRELGMTACAMTDHGALYGTVDFYKAMVENGIRPILGCEVYLAPRSRFDKDVSIDREPAHLILLAENNTGWRNLMKLVSAGFTDGFYYRPRIDRELLAAHSEGLIALSACLGGEIAQAIVGREHERARRLAIEYRDLFGEGNFFLELQDNGIPDQNLVNAVLISLSRELDIPLVATADCHYLRPEDAKAHDVLLCMQTGKRVGDTDRMRMDSDRFYLRTPQEMAEAFAAVPEALANTVRIAERCHVELIFGKPHLPAFDVPPGQTAAGYLNELAEAGLKRLLETPRRLPAEEYHKRLDYELSVINKMAYADYYLIVWDFIRHARERDIMVGPGRGSGAGSLVAYALRITNIDPLEYGLIFERFLNPDRISMPDFDIDFCYERRQEVIDYVTAKYGQDHVAQVITFGTLAARACIRDVARALELSYADTDRLAKMVPARPGVLLEKALEENPELRREYAENSIAREVIDLAMYFEGMPRHASTHAAGVVISSGPLTDIAPLSRNDESIVVQFSKDKAESIGLLKFDFLGLRTLTVLRDTRDMVAANGGGTIDFDRIPLDDPAVYRMIGAGDTDAVFQLESRGMTSFMKDLKPENIIDIINGISLFRPGPMDQIPRFVEARHDPQSIHYDHPLLEPSLNWTHGCMIYQEQVMQIVRDLAGFSMAQSDTVRRAMSKKKPAEMIRYQNLFIYGGKDEKGNDVPGALARGVPLAVAEEIFVKVMAFAGYAFPQGHAAAYGLVAYQTAWLKVHHPVEFMAGMFNSYLGSLGQAAKYMRTCRKMGIRILPPDINRSTDRFTTEAGCIRFSLAAVKNVGGAAIRALIDERTANGPYLSYGDFLRRIGESDLNRKMVESLIRASALDTFGIARSRMIAVIDPFLNQLAATRRQTMEGQISLFDLGGTTEAERPDRAEPVYPELADFPREERLAMEKEMLGLYVSGHPLDPYDNVLRNLATLDTAAFGGEDEAASPNGESGDHPLSERDGERVVMGGLLLSRKQKTTKNNELMCFATFEDLFGPYEVIVFPRTLETYGSLLQDGQALLIGGRLSVREEESPKLIAEALAPLTDEQTELPAEIAAVLRAYNGRPERRRSNGGTTRAESPREASAPTAAAAQMNTAAPTTSAAPSNMPAPTAVTSRAHTTLSTTSAAPPNTTAPTAVAATAATASRQPVALRIRYQGQIGDPGYTMLLATLRYFAGDTPVKLETREPGQGSSSDINIAVTLDDRILNILAARYGAANLELVSL